MSKTYRHTTSYITKAAFIAALYVVLTELSAQVGLSGTNMIRFRLSEALTILPFFTSAAIPGLAIGCLFANILTGAAVWDVVFGTLATLIGAILTYLLRKNKWLAPVPPILANTLIVPFVLRYAYGMTESWWLLALFVFIGEFVCCGILGMLLLFALNKRPGLLADVRQPEEAAQRRPLKELFPPYVLITFAFLLTVDLLVFYATRPLLPHLSAHDLATSLDLSIPLMPGWVIIYFLSFLSWVISFLWILRESKRHAYRLCGSFTIIMAVTLICFLAYPVTIERPEITEPGILNDMMRFLYWVDSPTNLCPSIHVIASYLCWRCTTDCKKIPKWYQWFNLEFLILVCFSILFVKQHFVIDIFTAIILSEAAVQIGRHVRIERIGFAIENAITKRRRGEPQPAAEDGSPKDVPETQTEEK